MQLSRVLTLSPPNPCQLEMSDLELFKDQKITALSSVITQPNTQEIVRAALLVSEVKQRK